MMKSSQFFRLSPELRNAVYEYALSSTDEVDIRYQPPLTMTCRKVRQECLLLFYSSNDFKVEVRKDTSRILAKSSTERVRSMRRLKVVYNLSNLENQPDLCREGGWIDLAKALIQLGFVRDQVEWKAESSTSLVDCGGNYLAYLAINSRVRAYDEIIRKDWEQLWCSSIAKE